MPPLAAGERLARIVAARAKGDATLNTALGLGGRIARDLAKAGTAYPLATFSVMASVDLTTRTGVHVWSDVQLLWKVIGKGASYEPLVPLAERLAVLFDGYTVEAEGVLVVKLRRTSSPPQPPEVTRGVQFRYLNQLFETEVYPI